MKKRLLFIVLPFIFVFSSHAQWEEQWISESTAMTNVFFLNKNVGFAISKDMVLFKTKNGGEIWFLHHEITAGATEFMGYEIRIGVLDIYFKNEAETFLVNDDGVFTYNVETQNLSHVLKRSNCIGLDKDNEGNFYVGFQDGAIYKSESDSWTNWTLLCTTPCKIDKMSFHSTQKGAIIGVDGLYITSNAGTTWEKTYSFSSPMDYYTTLYPQQGIGFGDENNLFAITRNPELWPQTNFLYTSNDGGSSWKVEELDKLGGYVQLKFKGKYGMVSYGINTVRLTNDCGKTWFYEGEPTTQIIYGVHISNSNDFYLACSYKCVYKYENSSENTGIEPMLGDNDIAIYPNPAKDYINVTISPEAIGKEVLILDTRSNIVLRAKTMNQYSQIDISSLPTGVYLVKIGRIIRKLIKK